MSVTIIDRLLSFRKQWAGWRFDRRYGIETSLVFTRDELRRTPSELRVHAGAYIPTNPNLFRRMMRKVNVDLREYSFVDLGCGKGRILIAAAEYPFKAIMGIESDAGVYEAATQNLRRWRKSHPDGRLKIIHGDARQFEAPEGNLLVYMYNPFLGPVFDRVCERLAGLAAEPDRAVLIVYSSDWNAAELERTGRFVRVRMRRRQFWAASTVSFFYNEAANQMRRKH